MKMMMKKHRFVNAGGRVLLVWSAALAMVAPGCGGNGTDIDIPAVVDTTTRELTGQSIVAMPSGTKLLALSPDGEVVAAPLGADGSFSAALTIGKDYFLHFATDTAFQASVFFAADRFGDRTSRLTIDGSVVTAPGAALTATAAMRTASALQDAGSSDVAAAAGEDNTIDLGEVTCAGGACSVQHNPLEGFDSDDDGTIDIDDVDDDDDGIPDGAEHDDDDVSSTNVALLLPVKLDPSPSETGVSLGDDIRIAFNQPLDYTTLFADPSDTATWPAYFEVRDAQGVVVAGTLKCEHDQSNTVCDNVRRLRLRPASELEPCADYTVWVAGQLSAVGGAVLGQDLGYGFRTECEDDERPWAVKEVRPRNGATVEATTDDIKVKFTQHLAADSIDGQLALTCGDAGGLAVAGQWEIEETEAKFVPDAALPLGTCTLNIGSGLQSVGGDTLGLGFAVTFTVVDDVDVDDHDADEADDEDHADEVDDEDHADEADDEDHADEAASDDHADEGDGSSDATGADLAP